ncbi:Spondin_N [Nitrosomonas aestuarii]|uniref:Spondin_N n=1 Tax=Nitrosomonas aestuarii TaxID=52441 RepID=A0A1I3YBU6_9PROT|nr:spondin domain-containing protein [Nitrosomonas aestuarii]SFK28849.1 Spondin_N [Nitrosomonas aestuarii]
MLIKKIMICLALFCVSQSVISADYRIEINNLTYKIAFTPRIVIAHVPVSFFAAGDNLNDTTAGLLNGQINNALKEIAEAGNLGPIIAILDHESIQNFVSYTVGNGLLPGGRKQTVELLDVDETLSNISLFAMMLPTNDGFIALNNMELPRTGSVRYHLNAYDAGTETNTESCADIPGPLCEGTAQSPDDTGEGFVHIHRGIKGLTATVNPAEYDWKNPVAVVTITRIQ